MNSLFVYSTDPDIDAIAARLFGILDIADFEKRYSENKERGQYYQFSHDGLTFQLMHAFDKADGREYYLIFERLDEDSAKVESAFKTFANRLNTNGFKTALMWGDPWEAPDPFRG